MGVEIESQREKHENCAIYCLSGVASEGAFRQPVRILFNRFVVHVEAPNGLRSAFRLYYFGN